MGRRWSLCLIMSCLFALIPSIVYAEPTSTKVEQAFKEYRQAQAELNSIQNKITSIDQRMQKNFQELAIVKEQEEKSKKRLKQMMVHYYVLGQDKTTAQILSAKSLPQFFFRLEYLRLMMQRDQEAVDKYKEQLRQISAKQKGIIQESRNAKPLLQAAEKKSKHLQKQYQQLLTAKKQADKRTATNQVKKETKDKQEEKENKSDEASVDKLEKPVDLSWLHKARSMIGTVKYRFGASNYPYFDCSSWTQYVFKKYRGISLPRTANAQTQVGIPVSKEDLQPGDLVFFQGTYKAGISHVGIYLGNDHYISNKNERLDLQIDSLNDSYQREHYWGARRVN